MAEELDLAYGLEKVRHVGTEDFNSYHLYYCT